MMQPELLHPSWPLYNMDSTINQVGLYGLEMDVGGCDFSSSFISHKDSSGIFSTPSFPSLFPSESEFVDLPVEALQFVIPMEEIWQDMDGFDSNLSSEFEGVGGLLDDSEGSFPSEQLSIGGVDEWSPCPSMSSSNTSMDITSSRPSLTLPEEDMEIDNQLTIRHLLKAYGEAMENDQRELAVVIVRSITEKVSPLGETIERLAFNLFQDKENHDGDYLKQESCKNLETAFKTFYQMFPYGRFAHFAANSAILEAVPSNTKTIHLVDFDMGEGIQWPPLLEAIRHQQKAVKLTSIKWEEEDCSCAPKWRFEETKRRLYDHARTIGLQLKLEEVEVENLVTEIKRMKKRGRNGEWLAFNCMVALPHMRRGRSRRNVMEFLRTAKDLIADSADSSSSNTGIITFGDGDAGEKLKNCSGYGSFFDRYLTHYQTLSESMEMNFPNHLAEARMTMEYLFLAPFVSSLAWIQKWEEIKEGCDLHAGIELKGWRVSKVSLMEAKEMVKEGKTSYGVRIEGQQGNEMVLEWRGTPLVKVSTWR